MPTPPRPTSGGAPPGAAPSAREKWEQAASHRSHGGSSEGRAEFVHKRDGVFYPSGYAVLLLAPEDARALHDALEAAGFARARMMQIEPADTAELMRDSEVEAGTMARMVGAEIHNTAVMRQLAEAGNAMLVVRVASDEQERALVATARQWRVRKALRYHTLAVQELRIGAEEVPGESPYGVNEVLRSKPTEARLKPRKGSAGEDGE